MATDSGVGQLGGDHLDVYSAGHCVGRRRVPSDHRTPSKEAPTRSAERRVCTDEVGRHTVEDLAEELKIVGAS